MLRVPKEAFSTHPGKGWLSGAKSSYDSTQPPGQKAGQGYHHTRFSLATAASWLEGVANLVVESLWGKKNSREGPTESICAGHMDWEIQRCPSQPHLSSRFILPCQVLKQTEKMVWVG